MGAVDGAREPFWEEVLMEPRLPRDVFLAYAVERAFFGVPCVDPGCERSLRYAPCKIGEGVILLTLFALLLLLLVVVSPSAAATCESIAWRER